MSTFWYIRKGVWLPPLPLKSAYDPQRRGCAGDGMNEGGHVIIDVITVTSCTSTSHVFIGSDVIESDGWASTHAR